MPELSRLSGLLFFVGWAMQYFPLKPMRGYRRLWIVLAIPALFFFLLSEFLFLPGMCLSVFLLLHTSNNKDGQREKELTALLVTLLFYGIFCSFYRYSPYVWHVFQKAAFFYSVVVTSLADNEMTLGATAVGLPITITILSYCLGLFLWKRKVWFLCAAVIMPVLANICWLGLQKSLVLMVQFFGLAIKPDPLDLQVFLLLISFILLFPLRRNLRLEEGTRSSVITLKRLALPIVFVVLGMSILTFYKNGVLNKGTVVFLDKGTNWSVPVYGKKYGQNSAGMFGLLPYYLQMRGFKTKLHKTELNLNDLKNAAILVIFNPAKFFTGPEKQLIHKFVENGGSLLVAGDHSDVNGIMGPINDIIAPFNIKLNFDTALPLNTGWVDSLEKRPHPIMAKVREDYETGIWVGASLEVYPPAAPVIVGKLGWADLGSYKNTKRAFLGDYKRSPSEQLGDVVLVAESTYGKGRVLVFGDTSTFQNGILPLTYSFIDEIIDWLLSADGASFYPLLQLSLAGIFLLAGCFLLLKNPAPFFLTISLVLIILVPLISNMSPLKFGTEKVRPFEKGFYRPAFFDNSHLGRFALLSSTDDSLWGLSLNLLRSKIFPLFLAKITPEALASTEFYFVVAPTKEFSQAEKNMLAEFMQKGGKVIWSVGWEESKASESFLSDYDLSIEAVPLGAAEVLIRKSKMQFVEAWPVAGGGSNKRVIAEKWDYPVMLFQPVGKGGLLVVGDSYFFFSKNIESYKKYNMHNIRMIKYLMDYLGKV